MLRSLKSLHDYVITAKDDTIGRVNDFYFDDISYTVRYMVVDTGHWLPGRKVLVAQRAVGTPDWEKHVVPVSLTREQIKSSPEINADLPVSRQQEMSLHEHFGWPFYWTESVNGHWTLFPIPELEMPPILAPESLHNRDDEAANQGDPHLRSVNEIKGYQVLAADAEVGHVRDFIADDERWEVRFIVIDVGKWLPTRKILVPPACFECFDCNLDVAKVSLTRDKILNCPEFHPTAGVNRKQEEKLYDYYGRPTCKAEAVKTLESL